MKPTQFQECTQKAIKKERSLLLVAPTGLGKTFAVTGDLIDGFHKTIYAVPLRALGNDICHSISQYRRNGEKINVVTHHGAIQESQLFGEEVIVTTYDQIVCAVPGLPLSLPLKAGHAVAGALLISRLIFDEAHLAWGISENALAILLAIVKFRAKYGLQTILQTATLPDAISELLKNELQLELIRVGNAASNDEVKDDEGLQKRNENRHVQTESIMLKNGKKQAGEDTQKLDFAPLIERLKEDGPHNRIYFANTVDRIQEIYDDLIKAEVSAEKIIVLHNRMPHKQRAEVEIRVRKHFGEDSTANGLILLTNQVAEAGLNISAALVISDPAPVDTLVQREGRCARWFRKGRIEGRFVVIKVPATQLKQYSLPYREPLVQSALSSFPEDQSMTWEEERNWINKSWGGGEEKALLAVRKSLNDTTFALNLFDRAAQENQPGQIASVFREILSVEVAVEQGNKVETNGSMFATDFDARDLSNMIAAGERPDTSSISVGKAFSLLNEAAGNAAVIRYEEGETTITKANSVQVGDVLILPSSMAYLHTDKGLCFGNGNILAGHDKVELQSEWHTPESKNKTGDFGEGHRQTLSGHTKAVMGKATQKLSDTNSPYRDKLVKILKNLEGLETEAAEQLASVVVQITRVAIAFHDLGKANVKWQERVLDADPEWMDAISTAEPDAIKLVGRSLNPNRKRVGVPHTPPGYTATVEACRLLLGGDLGDSTPLVRSIALASCRHHSSLFQPANMKDYNFKPHHETAAFVRDMLAHLDAPAIVVDQAEKIIEAAQKTPSAQEVPLMLPNHDLFPLYALIGRAILLADREDAAGKDLEKWA